jgi:hypothetical protein
MQTHNSTTQHIETVLNIVNKVQGDPPKHRHTTFSHRGLTSGDELIAPLFG